MSELNFLQHIQEGVGKAKLESALLEPSQEIAFPRLLVNLGNDYKLRERILEISAIRQEQVDDSNEIYRVQFFLKFPFKATETTVFDAGSLVLFINSTIEFPGFELYRIENELYYRHVTLTTATGLPPQAVSSIVGIILMLLDLFTEVLEKVAIGDVTFTNLMEHVIEK